MKKTMRILRWLAILVACGFLVLQLIRPAKTNPSGEMSQSINAHLQVSPQVAAIVDRSCNDCHSNHTRWPWYSNVAPVSWFVINHVKEGRRHLNFSDWGRLNQREAEGMLKQICQEVKLGSMPLSSYTPLHPGSTLSPEDVKTLCDWANAERERVATR
jgi:hypothetical protein